MSPLDSPTASDNHAKILARIGTQKGLGCAIVRDYDPTTLIRITNPHTNRSKSTSAVLRTSILSLGHAPIDSKIQFTGIVSSRTIYSMAEEFFDILVGQQCSGGVTRMFSSPHLHWETEHDSVTVSCEIYPWFHTLVGRRDLMAVPRKYSGSSRNDFTLPYAAAYQSFPADTVGRFYFSGGEITFEKKHDVIRYALSN